VPKGAQVLVDGQPAGTTPTILRLPPFKPFTVALQSPDHEGWQMTLTSDTVSSVQEVLPRKPYWSRPFTSGLLAGPYAESDRVFAVSGDGTVWALSAADGGERWQLRPGVIVTARPVLAGPVLVLAGSGGLVYGLEASDGSERWRFNAGDAVKGAPRYDERLGLVFFGTLDKNIYGLEAETGQERWRFATSGNVEASPTFINGTVVCGSLDGRLYALDAETGRLLWRFDAGGPVARAVAADSDLVYFANLKGEVLACALGSRDVTWRYRSQKSLVTGVALVEGAVCFATEGGVLLGLDRAGGAPLWRVQGPERVTSLRADGDRIWVGRADGSLACLEGRTGEPIWQVQLERAVEWPLWVAEGRVYAATSAALWCFPR